MFELTKIYPYLNPTPSDSLADKYNWVINKSMETENVILNYRPMKLKRSKEFHSCQLQWECIASKSGPPIAFHAGAIVGDYFYVHGGLCDSCAKTKISLNGFYRIQIYPVIGDWTCLTTKDSPFLSQHQCVVWKNQILIFIGGWTGKTRIAGLHFFNTESCTWLPPALVEPDLIGFPAGAGLSAHSVVPFENTLDNNLFSAVVLGREGSTRIQRRCGNAYILQGSLREVRVSAPGDHDEGQIRPQFIYSEAPSAVHIESRSYHTSLAVSPGRIVTVGGRSNSAVEVIDFPSSNHHPNLAKPATTCAAVSRLLGCANKELFEPVSPEKIQLYGWRGHYAIPGNSGFFIGGGDGFSALRPEPLDMGYIYSLKSNAILRYAGRLNDRRAYAVCSVNPTDETAWLHGGLGPGLRPLASLMRLKDYGRTRELNASLA